MASNASSNADQSPLPECQDLSSLLSMLGGRYETYQRFAYLCNVYVVPVLTVLCLVGYGYAFNYIKHKARCRSFKTSRFMRHISFLCIWDCALTFIACFAQTPSYIAYDSMKHFGNYMAVHIFVVHPLGQMAMTLTQWQLLVLSVERFLVIWKPLKMRYVCQMFGVGKLTCCVVGVAVMLHIPYHLIEFTISTCTDPSTEQVTIQTTRRLFFENSAISRLVFVSLPRIVFTSPTPFLILLLTTALTLRQAANQWYVGQYRLSLRLSVVLAVTNIKYLLCSSVYIMSTATDQLVTRQTDESFYEYFLLTLYATELSNVFLMLHSATNWLLLINYRTYDKKSLRLTTFPVKSSTIIRATLRTSLLPMEGEILKEIWSMKCTEQLTDAILLGICTQNRVLAKRLYGSVDIRVLNQHPFIIAHYSYIKTTLDSLLADYLKDPGSIDTRMRQLGGTHFNHHVTLTRHDWSLLKRCLDGIFNDTIFLKLWYPSVDMEKLRRFWVVFTGALVHNFKTGFICEQVEQTQSFRYDMRHNVVDATALLHQPSSRSDHYFRQTSTTVTTNSSKTRRMSLIPDSDHSGTLSQLSHIAVLI